MEINKNTLAPFLIYNKPFVYNDSITLYPVTMNDILLFQALSSSITIRKNSTFHNKKIIKMTYLEFLLFALENKELEEQYNINGLSQYFFYAVQLLQLCCKSDQIVLDNSGELYINNIHISSEMFDDLRRIIIIQNDIDFDIDEFLNYDTEQQLKKAAQEQNKNKSSIEDYVDSLVIAMNSSEDKIMNMTIRKFWRYIKRYQLYESYAFAKAGEYSGLVSFKEPIRYWMTPLKEEDTYKHLKTNESELKSKMG